MNPSSEVFFYHSFPAGAVGKKNEIEMGLAILDSIIKNGMLLNVEITDWIEPVDDGKVKLIKLVSTSCSFTQLASWEIHNHSEYYGKFALEFEIINLRKLGVLPVFYLPCPKNSQDGLNGLGPMIVTRLSETRSILEKLNQLMSALKSQADEGKKYIEILDPEQNSYGKIPIPALNYLLSGLAKGGQSFKVLRNSVNSLANLIYPTEKDIEGDILGNYRQREWRIPPNIIKSNVQITRGLNEQEKKSIIATNSQYFGSKFELPNGKEGRRIDFCKIYPSFEGRAFIDYVRRVIVPKEALEDAVIILQNLKSQPQLVTLDSIPKSPNS